MAKARKARHRWGEENAVKKSPAFAAWDYGFDTPLQAYMLGCHFLWSCTMMIHGRYLFCAEVDWMVAYGSQFTEFISTFFTFCELSRRFQSVRHLCASCTLPLQTVALKKVHNPFKKYKLSISNKTLTCSISKTNGFNFLPKAIGTWHEITTCEASPRCVKQYWKRASVWIVQCLWCKNKYLLKLVCGVFLPFGRSSSFFFQLILCFCWFLLNGENNNTVHFCVLGDWDHEQSGSKTSYSRMIVEDRVQSLFKRCTPLHHFIKVEVQDGLNFWVLLRIHSTWLSYETS